MKQIDVSTPTFPNTFALVDDEDFGKVSKYKWGIREKLDTLYAVRTFYDGNHKRSVSMHRFIMANDHRGIDHRDGNGLNNQKHNLRFCEAWQNAGNRKLHRDNTSGFRGVSWDKQKNKWRARLFTKNGVQHLGHYFCIVKAAVAYDKAAIKYFKEFAGLNFPAMLCAIKEKP